MFKRPTFRKLTVATALALGGLIAAPVPGIAQDSAYPSDTVTLVVGSNPGGPTDVLARLLAERLEKVWEKPVIVDNRPGGAQMIGTNSVAKAEPDGLTLLLSNDGPVTINPNLYSKMEYDPATDLAPVTMVVELPLMLVVTPGLEADSVEALIELAKADPGSINFASGGSTSMMAAMRFSVATGTELVNVPYKGSGPSIQALMAGEVDIMFDGLASSLPQVQAGNLRALAVTSAERIEGLDDVPTIGETVPGYAGSTWLGAFAPAGTPEEIVNKIRDDMAAVVAEPELRERLVSLGMYPVTNTPDEFAGMLAQEVEEWGKVVREAGIPMEN